MIAGRDAVARGLLCIAAGAVALLVAFWLEHAQGLAPCALCLWERVPYRLLAATGLAWVLLGAIGRSARPVWGVAVLIALSSVLLGGLHVGVEQHWWPDPLPQCQAPHFAAGASFADRMASMPMRPAKPCDAANYPVPGVPISVVTLAFAYAVAVLLVLLAAGPGRRRRMFDTRPV